jgi:hypothetical protein
MVHFDSRGSFICFDNKEGSNTIQVVHNVKRLDKDKRGIAVSNATSVCLLSKTGWRKLRY